MSKYARRDVRDKNHSEITDFIRKHGFEVIDTERPLDCLIVNSVERAGWMEIKVPGSNGLVSRGQLRFMANTTMPVAFVRTPEEGLEFARTLVGITPKQKVEIELFLAMTTAKQFVPNTVKKVLAGKRMEVVKDAR